MMKNIFEAPFVREMCETTANMYRLGWDERNGGNISYLLDEKEVGEYLDLTKVLRTIPLMGVNEEDFDASPLEGRSSSSPARANTSRTWKRPRDQPRHRPHRQGRQNIELLWGYKGGGRPTSEFPPT